VRKSVGNIGLVGVDKNYRSQGIGKLLITASDNYFNKAGCKKIEVVTQGENRPACLLYEKNGFSVQSQFNFYHLWL
jgi:dTDP-4-amino-4,6-dideoxy-D-galactose acyltransferase